MTDTTFQVNGLRKSFKGAKGAKPEVLKGVDFEVRRGEIFALLGSNGADKTTTVNILSTLPNPDGGNASVRGFDVERQPEKARENISLTGQFAAVDGILTGRKKPYIIAKLRSIRSSAQIADRLLERFGKSEAFEQAVGHLFRRYDAKARSISFICR